MSLCKEVDVIPCTRAAPDAALRCCAVLCRASLQGFTREITLPRDNWVGYIKDYDGGTLMEYVINPKIPYADLVGMFKVCSAGTTPVLGAMVETS